MARIETLLEALPEIREEIKALRKEFEDDKAELAALKNKGTGLLIGVGLAGGTIGAALSKAWAAVVGP